MGQNFTHFRGKNFPRRAISPVWERLMDDNA